MRCASGTCSPATPSPTSCRHGNGSTPSKAGTGRSIPWSPGSRRFQLPPRRPPPGAERRRAARPGSRGAGWRSPPAACLRWARRARPGGECGPPRP
ncbi:MAG: hypothetical protein EOP91_07075 [Lysobacteraceae bacterium]|nr:MAG: hypothetical protein EOP91_07075 [Xanthomonadaceae bacterium]